MQQVLRQTPDSPAAFPHPVAVEAVRVVERLLRIDRQAHRLADRKEVLDGLRPHLLEVPAGKLNDGEDPLDCAVRELSEETGFTAQEFTFLGELLPSPGYCKETLYLYLATGLKPGKAHLDPGEFLDVECHSLREVTDMVMRNELTDAKTAMAVLKAKLLLDGKE